MSLEGHTLGEFEILSRLGQGGMGAVYKARQTSLDRLVALKTLQASFAADAEFIARFRREAKAAAALIHPNLVQVFSAGETQGLHWFAMEFVEGESAQSRLRRKGKLDLPEAIAIATHIATALEYGWRKAHLIHRDVKPDNIFLSNDGEVKLGDLGLAKNVGGATDEAQSLTMTGSSMGTPHYISPEQGQGKKDVDFRADIYSLGCTLYHLVSGKPPYAGDTALAVMMQHVTAPVPNLAYALPGCPQSLAVAVMKMMAKDPAHRQQAYADVIADLRRAYDEIAGASVPPSVAAPSAVPQPFSRPPARPPAPKPAAPKATATPLAVDSSAQTVVYPAPGGELPAPPAKSKARLWAAIAAGVAVLGIAAFFAFGKREPQLSETERAEKERGRKAATASPSPATATKDAPFVNTLGMKFVPVPGTQVLFSIWDTRVMDYEKYAAAKPGVDGAWKALAKDGVPVGREKDHPVVGVNWEDAQAFCQWLTEKETSAGVLPKGAKYRLPTDAEWSTAVGLPPEQGAMPEAKSQRSKEDFPWGKEWPPIKRVGNYADESFHAKFPKPDAKDPEKIKNEWVKGYDDGFATTSPVGAFPANAYGLYDMGGNVWQWCTDTIYGKTTTRTMRGACWNVSEKGNILASYRVGAESSQRSQGSYGFRCVLEPGPSATATAGVARVAEPPVAKQTLDLLALVDPVRDRVMPGTLGKANEWEKTGGVLRYKSDGKSGKIAVPVAVDARRYEFAITFARPAGSSQLNMDLPLAPGKIFPVALLSRGVKVLSGVGGPEWPAGLADRGRITVRYEADAAGAPPRVLVEFDGKPVADVREDVQRWAKAVDAQAEFPGQSLPSLFSMRDSFEISEWTLRIFDGEAMVLRGTANASSAASPAAGALLFGGHRYQLVTERCLWTEAKAKAAAMGGHLATVTSPEERKWMESTFVPQLDAHRMAWVGGYRDGAAGMWTWITGEAFPPDLISPGWTAGEEVSRYVGLHNGPQGVIWNYWDTSGKGTGEVYRCAGFIVEWDEAAPAAR